MLQNLSLKWPPAATFEATNSEQLACEPVSCAPQQLDEEDTLEPLEKEESGVERLMWICNGRLALLLGLLSVETTRVFGLPPRRLARGLDVC